MKMSPALVVGGSLIIFTSVLVIAVILPWKTISEQPSDIFRPRTALEEEGRRIYVNNGCTYCHTQFIRNIDWGDGSLRVARAGDYVADRPHLLGTERTGPDLSQAGGEHPDDWHLAHFLNPRFTRPESVMPSWAFFGPEKLTALTAYVQSLGFADADARTARQKMWKAQAIAAYEAGPDQNIRWLHSTVAPGWQTVTNPYPTTAADLERGHRIYQSFCIGCHGPVGDGMGEAEPHLYPPPLNFTLLKGRGVSGGILYYQIMNGITGTAMPYFKVDLESAKIWDVGNYIAQQFIGENDAGRGLRGIEAANETPSAVIKPGEGEGK
ncbi:MAG: cbb3-type cytochrome c oxidase subunit II [Desulfobulbaceae bacterium]